MVKGLAKFKEFFEGYEECYTIIGGVACSVLFDEVGGSFRATKDFDVVLIAEAIDKAFVKKLWTFIVDGNYAHRNKSGEGQQFYRFEKPKDKSYPYMIELFSRVPDALEFEGDGHITPLPIEGSIASLSAILLDEAYYTLLKSGRRNIDGLSVLEAPHVLLFKVKAYLDLLARKEAGDTIDSKNVKKHKNDVFKLASILDPGRSSKISIGQSIYEELMEFLKAMKASPVDPKNLGLGRVTFTQLIEQIEATFEVTGQ